MRKKLLTITLAIAACLIGFMAQAIVQTDISIQGFSRTNGSQTSSAGIVASTWSTQQIPVQSGSSYTFNNQNFHGDVTVTLNGTINFQESTSLTDVVTSSSLTVTLESASTSNPYWFYSATVKTGNGDAISGCTTSVSSDRKTLTVTIPSGTTFGKITVSYATHEPFSDSNTVISGVESEYIYYGSPVKPVPTVTYYGTVLTEGTDYTYYIYGNGADGVGNATLYVEGAGEYAGRVNKSYIVRNLAPSDFNSLGNNTFEIATTTDLDNLAILVNIAANTCSGITFMQTADIVYSYTTAWNSGGENNFTAIGGYGKPFSGTYDGQNHTISGIRIKKPTDKYQGLFGNLSDGTVKNVVLADTHIKSGSYAGGIAGVNNDGNIEDCRVESNVSVNNSSVTSNNYGGIVGECSYGGTVSRCTFSGEITVETTNSNNSPSGNVGGIVGNLKSATVSNCLVLGATITSQRNIGAIVGDNNGTLTANYYHDCLVRNTKTNTESSTNVGVGFPNASIDQDGARSVHVLTLPANVTATGESVDIDGVTHYASATTVTLACSNVPIGQKPVYSVNGNAIEGNTFTMPRQDATVTVTIVAIDYTITLPTNPEHFTVTSDKATAHIGDTVTLTVTTEDESYIVSSLTVMNGDSEVEVTSGENNTYTFVMPAANVIVNVEIQRLRYTFDSTTGVLKLFFGEFNKDNNWGSDVTASAVKSVTATSEVSFTGDCTQLFDSFTNCTSMDLSNVNTDGVTKMNSMFYNCLALTSLDLTGWNTANVTNMASIFASCNSLTTLEGISDWNTAAVTDMSSMFFVCSALTSLDLSNWNTAAVNYMNDMFRGCSALTSLTLSGWNTAAVTDMAEMFSGCMALTTIEGISSWNTAEVIDMSGMFYYCSSLTSLDLSGWDTGKVAAIHEEGHNGMFQKCTGLTSLNLTGWNMGNITDMSQMFYDCSNLTTIEGISGWDVSNVTDMHSMFYGCSSLGSLDLSGWNTSEVTKMSSMFGGCSNLATIYAGKEWNTENVTISGGMFSNCTSLVGGMSTTFDPDHTNAEYARYDHGYDEPGYLTGVFTLILPEDVTTTAAATLTHNGVNYYKAGSDITLSYNGTPPENMRFYHFTVGGEPIDGDTFAMPFADAEIGVELQARYTFDSTTGVLALIWGEFNKDNKWGNDVNKNYVTSITATDEVSFTGDCTELFWDFTNCTSMDLSNVNTDSLTNAMMMFENCQNLESLNLSGWNTASVTNMQNMFSSCPRLNSLDITGWNTANVTNMINTFGGCSSLKTLDLSGWNTASVTNMNGMFACCDSLKTIDFSGWNTASVTNMSLMFYQCFSLETLDLTGWNTASVTNMHSMFEFCSSLQSLNLIGWNTASVTNMSNMFHNCESLTSLDLSGWNTGNVTDMRSMFYGCSNLASLDVSHFDTGNVTDMRGMFYGCSSLETLDLSGWNTGNVTTMDNMFSYCSNLMTIYAGAGWTTESVTSSEGMFYGCTSLVGGMGTTYGDGKYSARYAHIDGGTENPGYFTEKPAFVPGDVNGDGDVNVIDITALIDEIMNDGTNPRADVNEDGEINVIDITALIDIIMNS